jgi:hypothetical protein
VIFSTPGIACNAMTTSCVRFFTFLHLQGVQGLLSLQ